MAKSLDLGTKIALGGLLVTVLVLFVGDNLVGRLFPGGEYRSAQSRDESARAEARTIAIHSADSSISVLLDASLSWHSHRSTAENSEVVGDVSNAVTLSAQYLPQPLVIRYHSGSPHRVGRPICTMTFEPGILPSWKGAVTGLSDLRRILGNCSRVAMSIAPYASDDLFASVVSAARATALADIRAPRTLLILSDFRSPPPPRGGRASVDLSRLHIVMLYRSTPGSQAVRDDLDRRVGAWLSGLRELGANVEAYDENVASVPRQLATVLARPPSD